jgi:hypothetical protein
MRLISTLATIVALSTPALAFEIEDIGQLDATFGGARIAQPTVLVRDGDEAQATAFLMVLDGGFSSLSLAGYSMDNQRLGIDLDFMVSAPAPQTAPLNLTITYAPAGGGGYWTSEEAPIQPAIGFTTLELGEGEGRAAGTFSGTLCLAETYGASADPGNCRPIEGSFDTRFFIE